MILVSYLIYEQLFYCFIHVSSSLSHPSHHLKYGLTTVYVSMSSLLLELHEGQILLFYLFSPSHRLFLSYKSIIIIVLSHGPLCG